MSTDNLAHRTRLLRSFVACIVFDGLLRFKPSKIEHAAKLPKQCSYICNVTPHRLWTSTYVKHMITKLQTSTKTKIKGKKNCTMNEHYKTYFDHCAVCPQIHRSYQRRHQVFFEDACDYGALSYCAHRRRLHRRHNHDSFSFVSNSPVDIQ